MLKEFMKEKIRSTVKSLTLRTVTSEPIARRFSAHFVLDIQQRTKFEHLKVRTHHLKLTLLFCQFMVKRSHSVAIFAVVISHQEIHITHFEVSHYLHTQNRYYFS